MRPSLTAQVRVANDANSMHSAGYFVDAIGRLFQDLAGEAPDEVEKVLNGYTLGGIAAGLRLVGTDLMSRGESLTAFIERVDSEEAAK
ncbi:hypothetical protein KVG88_06430 [Pseudomonas sp. SWRI74]|uniref:Uncharacterized protein n=1 Tax=Pseudomonas azerbaijanoccidentalis TaxID=2842347 RepID=A0ABS6QL70_9PSED|nr:hypothetical protein [Pseudomonas azerbaijanoccidentalis]MBV4519694.1 hypothetical protein [Pseudomonas azerbaijanoccidentalis]